MSNNLTKDGVSNSGKWALPFSKRTALLVAIVAVASIATATLVALLLYRFSSLRVPSLGTIRTVGVEVYWDTNIQNKTEVIEWGILWPGSSQNVILYIRSISNIETTLRLNTSNWNPANISQYVALSWNYNGATLDPGEIIQVTLTLSASSSTSFIQYLIDNRIKQFNFDIIFSTSEQG